MFPAPAFGSQRLPPRKPPLIALKRESASHLPPRTLGSAQQNTLDLYFPASFRAHHANPSASHYAAIIPTALPGGPSVSADTRSQKSKQTGCSVLCSRSQLRDTRFLGIRSGYNVPSGGCFHTRVESCRNIPCPCKGIKNVFQIHNNNRMSLPSQPLRHSSSFFSRFESAS